MRNVERIISHYPKWATRSLFRGWVEYQPSWGIVEREIEQVAIVLEFMKDNMGTRHHGAFWT